jgi:hypothetical protein
MTTITELITVKLSDAQLLVIGHDLSTALQALEMIKENWKVQRSQYNGVIEEKEINIKRLSNIIETGESETPVEVRIQYNHPRVGQKTFFVIDTGDDLRTEDMTEEEMQTELPL